MTRISVLAFACTTSFAAPLFAESAHAFHPAYPSAADGIKDDGYRVYNDDPLYGRAVVSKVSSSGSITIYLQQTNPNIAFECYRTVTNVSTGAANETYGSVSAVGYVQLTLAKPSGIGAQSLYCIIPPSYNGTTTKIFGFK